MDVAGAAIEIVADDGAARDRFVVEHRSRLVAPEDDMWAHLADHATPHAILIDGMTVGSCSVDDERQLLSFHLTDRFNLVASEVFAVTVDSLGVVAAVASTVDPVFLTLGLTTGAEARPVGLMYEHTAEPTSPPAAMCLALDDDHATIVAFDHEQTDSPFDFLEPYLAARIARGELAVLVDDGGGVVATGECRADTRSAGYAHLGLIVRTGDRSSGVGRKVLSAMVDLARSRGLRPVCSTEPTNLAAQRVIHDAGFSQRHSVMLVSMPR